MVYTFNGNAFRNLSNEKCDRDAFYRFSRDFRRWQKDMNLEGLKKLDAMKSVKENPWKQFKEAQPAGEEEAKNTRKQKLYKKRKGVQKLTRLRLENDGKPTPTVKKKKSIKKNDASASISNGEQSPEHKIDE